MSLKEVVVTIVGTNGAPTLFADLITVTEDVGTLPLGVLANDSDPDGDALTIVAVTQPARGTLLIAADSKSLVFEPGAAFEHLAVGQSDTVTAVYKVSDGHGETRSTSVTINVIGTNDAPVVSGPVLGTATEDDALSTLDALANASDIDDGTILSVVAPATLPAGVTFDAATNRFTLDASNAAYQSLAQGVTTVVTVNYGVSNGIAATSASLS